MWLNLVASCYHLVTRLLRYRLSQSCDTMLCNNRAVRSYRKLEHEMSLKETARARAPKSKRAREEEKPLDAETVADIPFDEDFLFDSQLEADGLALAAIAEAPEIQGLSPVALRLLQAASDMRESPDSYERAFLARQLIQCTFPHKDPGNIPIWSRTNGNLTLSIRPLYDEDKAAHKYPYGTIPRLFLYWMVTEAARTKNRRLYLGQTYPAFMRKLGLNPSNGGVRSDSRRLRDQIERMLRATISFKQTFRRDGKTGDAWVDMQIGPEAVLWWNFDQEDEQDSLFESYIELSDKFFSAITSSPIPLDLRALRALRKSPLALDLYSLICHKTYSARKDDDTKTIPWDGLHRQMGAEYKELRNFKQKVNQAIRKIRLVYPQMKVDLSETGMHIHPAPLAIPERATRETLPSPLPPLGVTAAKRTRRSTTTK